MGIKKSKNNKVLLPEDSDAVEEVSEPKAEIKNIRKTINISVEVVLSESNWIEILNDIGKADAFVTLDLSKCTKSNSREGSGLRSDGVFSPLSGNISSKAKIISLILPDEAVLITDAIYHYDSYLQFIWISVFKSFQNLETISGANIENIGSSAFRNCNSIVNIDFPKVKKIEEFAFSGCTKLTEVFLPEVKNLGNSAFEKCYSLTKVNFPMVLSVSHNVFEECASLTHIDMPKVLKLGDKCLRRIGNKDITITFGEYAPLINETLFHGIFTDKNVTLRIPEKSSSYDYSWLNSFRGGNEHINVIHSKS